MCICIARLVHAHRNARSCLSVIHWRIERCLLYGTKYFAVSFRDAFLRTVTFPFRRSDLIHKKRDGFNPLGFARGTLGSVRTYRDRNMVYDNLQLFCTTSVRARELDSTDEFDFVAFQFALIYVHRAIYRITETI